MPSPAAALSSFRVAFCDGAAPERSIELPSQSLWPVNLVVALFFLVALFVEWTTVGGLLRSEVRNVFDLMFVLFQGFWVLGWSAGVMILGALTALLCFYRQSMRIADRALVLISPRADSVHRRI